MNFILRLIVFILDPLGLGRRLLIRPALKLGYKVYYELKCRADEKVDSVKEWVLRIGLIAFVVIFIIWIAVFLYVAFYYTYMPAISHTRPAHMQFKSCLDSSTPCTFPNAHVSLTKKQQLLMVGQAYRVIVQIDMPESPQNLELGMFMVCGEMRDTQALLRGQSCRSAMMRYRSPLIRTITTWALSPLFVLGLKEEFQRIPVEIFGNYLEERQHPITDVYVEIQSQKIQFYTVSLHIVADFTGLRYIMHNWPILSAVVAISTNLFFILVIFLLSWYHWSDTTWLHNFRKKYAEFTQTLQSKASKAMESKSGLRDDEDLSYLDDNSSEIEEIGGRSTDSRSSSKEELLGRKPILSTEEQQELRLRRT
ncbi:seipin [Eurosta solidaginis]|uniref:seipin n=1 Tax=Eurosta solidaginis TaxID=178769 RepID=UPI0035317A34